MQQTKNGKKKEERSRELWWVIEMNESWKVKGERWNRHINVETDTLPSICSFQQQDNLEQIEIRQSFNKALIDWTLVSHYLICGTLWMQIFLSYPQMFRQIIIVWP